MLKSLSILHYFKPKSIKSKFFSLVLPPVILSKYLSPWGCIAIKSESGPVALKTLDDFQKDLEENDSKTLEAQSHSIKGGAANLIARLKKFKENLK
jgi:hypothetical protein